MNASSGSSSSADSFSFSFSFPATDSAATPGGPSSSDSSSSRDQGERPDPPRPARCVPSLSSLSSSPNAGTFFFVPRAFLPARHASTRLRLLSVSGSTKSAPSSAAGPGPEGPASPAVLRRFASASSAPVGETSRSRLLEGAPAASGTAAAAAWRAFRRSRTRSRNLAAFASLSSSPGAFGSALPGSPTGLAPGFGGMASRARAPAGDGGTGCDVSRGRLGVEIYLPRARAGDANLQGTRKSARGSPCGAVGAKRKRPAAGGNEPGKAARPEAPNLRRRHRRVPQD